MTLTDALDLALKNDPGLASAQLAVRTGDLQVREAYSAAMPQVSVSGQITRAMVSPALFVPGLGNMRFNLANDYAGDITLQQPIWLAGKVGLGLKAAKTYKKIARKALVQNRAQLKSDIIRDYFWLVLTRAVVDVTSESITLANRHAEMVKRMLDVGLSSEFDYLRAQVAIKTLEPDLAQAQQNASLAEIRLLDRLGLQPGINLVPIDQLLESDLALEKPVGNTPDEAFTSALNNRSELEIFALREELNSIAISAEERSLYLPNLFFILNYRRQAQQDVVDIANTYWVEGFNWMLSMNVPLFDGFATQARIQQKKIDLRKSQLDRLQLEQGIRLEVNNAVGDIKRTRKQVASQKAAEQLAEKAHEIAIIRFDQGVGTELDVLDAQLSLKNARLGLLQGLFERRIAEAEYARIVDNDDTYPGGN